MPQPYRPYVIELRPDDEDPSTVVTRNPDNHDDRSTINLDFVQHFCRPAEDIQADPQLDELAESKQESSPELAAELERLYRKHESGEWAYLYVHEVDGSVWITPDNLGHEYFPVLAGIKSDLSTLTRDALQVPTVASTTTRDEARSAARGYLQVLMSRAQRYEISHRVEPLCN